MSPWWAILACQREPLVESDPERLCSSQHLPAPPIPTLAGVLDPAWVHSSSSEEEEEPACPTAGMPTESGAISDPTLEQLSGIAQSQYPGAGQRFWVHEDRWANEIVAIDAEGGVHARYPLNLEMYDAEDIEVVRDPATGTSWLMLADIGDNLNIRTSISVLMVEEPDPDAGQGETLELTAMELRYPDFPRDAETLLVDPRDLDLFIVTKEQGVQARVFRKGAPHDDPGPHELEEVAVLPWIQGRVTGGDVAPDGSAIVLRTYQSTAWFWRWEDGWGMADTLLRPPCPIAIALEPQGEGVAFAGHEGSVLVTVSEGISPPLFQIPLSW